MTSYLEPATFERHGDDVDDAVPADRSAAGAVVGTVVAAIYLLATILAIGTASYDIWGGLLMAGVLASISLVTLGRLARKDPDPKLGMILILAFVVKQIGTFGRFWVVVNVTGGDADNYHNEGSQLAPVIRAMDFGSPIFEDLVPEVSGTAFIRLVTGILYALMGPSQLAGFMFFSFLGFWGLYLIFRSVRITLPDFRHRRLAALLFFAPSIVFWPSSIGKESWLIFTIGLSVYGMARLWAHKGLWLPFLAAGLLGSSVVRPHVTVLLVLAMVIGRIVGRVGRRADQGGMRRLVGRLVVLGFMVVAAGLLAGRVSTFFNVDSLNEDGGGLTDGGLTAILDETSRRSTQGGSAFEPPRITSPMGVPMALVTVLYRPFPHEAHNLQARATSLESTFFLVLTIMTLPRLTRLPRLMRRSPMVAFTVVFTLLFVIAFASIGNFGILARQRTQVLPMLFVLLSVPRLRPDEPDPEPEPHGPALRLAR